MRKIVFLLCFIVSGYMSVSAGTYVVGANQIRNLLDRIEQGTGEAPPVTPLKEDDGKIVINTDYDEAWSDMEGVIFTDTIVVTDYLDHSDTRYKWKGLSSIDFASKGYMQKDGMAISFVQPSLQAWDYPGSVPPDGYKDLQDYWDRNDLSWLVSIDLSGNDFHSIEIDGGPYRVMPLKTINLSNNPNLESLSVVNCNSLELVDVRGTALSETTLNWLVEDVHEFSPNAVILYGSTATNENDILAPFVRMKGTNICIENKMPGSQVSVYDLFGRLLLESGEDTLDASSLGGGIYVVKVDDWTTKVLKK